MSKSFKKAFGAALKEVREERKLSQSEIVRRTGLDRTTIPRYEKGDFNPLGEKIFLLAKALEVSPAYFVQKIDDHLK